MITKPRLARDYVWDIIHNGRKIGFLSLKSAWRYYKYYKEREEELKE